MTGILEYRRLELAALLVLRADDEDAYDALLERMDDVWWKRMDNDARDAANDSARELRHIWHPSPPVNYMKSWRPE